MDSAAAVLQQRTVVHELKYLTVPISVDTTQRNANVIASILSGITFTNRLIGLIWSNIICIKARLYGFQDK